MSDNKKYYYFRLTENFFNSEAMIVLESMPDGYLYSNILLKLYAHSLKGNGRLMFNDRIPYNATVLAKITRHQVGTMEKALRVFQDLGLIEVLDNGAIYMLDIQNFIGRSSTEADRKRNYRAQIEAERMLGQSVDKCPGECPDKSPPEIEKEIEIELEKESEKDILPGAEAAPGRSPSKKPNGAMTELPAAQRAVIELPLNDGTIYAVFQSSVDRWAELYPAVDVMQQLRAMVGWCEANPAKRKTKKGAGRFINSWLTREQDRGGAKNGCYQGSGGQSAGGNPFMDKLKRDGAI